MKVCMVTSSYPRYEGDFAGVFVKSLAEALAGIGHDVHVLAAYDPDIKRAKGGDLVKLHYFPYGVSRRMHVLGYARSLKSDAKLNPLAVALIPVYLASGFAALVRLSLRETFDVIHAHWVIPCGPIGALGSSVLRVPLVISLHGSDVFLAERGPAFAVAARLSFKAARSIAACSDDLRRRTIRLGTPKDKVITVPYGVDVQVFSRPPIRGQASETGDGRGECPLVLSVGRLVGKKGFEYFVRAVPLILERVPSARFAIIGDGDDKLRLLDLARELNIEDRIVFVGAVPWTEMPAYLSACDVFVVPSVRDPSGNVDGLPNTLLEAMAAGKAVVATRVAGIPETISHGTDGLLVAEKSHTEIAEAVITLLRSPGLAQRLGELAREKARRQFSWERAAQVYGRIYQSALEMQH